jgi:hypothetical protein
MHMTALIVVMSFLPFKNVNFFLCCGDVLSANITRRNGNYEKLLSQISLEH